METSNPFLILEQNLEQKIGQRLTSLENLLREIESKSTKSDEDEIGGMELAKKITGLSYPTIYGLVSTREIPHSKKGKKLYFIKSQLISWVKEGKRSTTSEIDQQASDYLTNKRLKK